MIVDTYITSKGCDIWGIDRLQQSDKLSKRSFACDGNLIGQQRLFMLVTHSTNSLRSNRSRMLVHRVRPPLTAAFGRRLWRLTTFKFSEQAVN